MRGRGGCAVTNYQFQFAAHVVARALWLALHHQDGGLRVPPPLVSPPACSQSPRGLEWRESVEATQKRR